MSTTSDIEVIEVGLESLGKYALIPISFRVASVFEVLETEAGTFQLSERELSVPLAKNFDELVGEGPANWPLYFDLSKWGFFLGKKQGVLVGAAAVAFDTPGVNMLEGRRDLGVLWDIRVDPEVRNNGMGRALLAAAENWARVRKCSELKIETQNVNVSACRFYESSGYTLRAIRKLAYPDFPEEIQFLYYKTLKPKFNILKVTMKKIAVIFAGAGCFDGTEIREGVAVFWALSSHPVEVEYFAPDIDQSVHINHLTGKRIEERRNVLMEAARFVPEKVRPLSALDPADFDALIIPGGDGTATNLSTFGHEWGSGRVIEELNTILTVMRETGKPIGTACMASTVIALQSKGEPLELAVGPVSDVSTEIEGLGHTNVVVRPNEIHVDRKHRIVSTPALMYENAPLHEVFEGIKKMVDEVVAMAGAPAAE